MNYFPNSNEEIELIKFIAKYQYLKVNNSKCFFSSSNYYRKRITKLISKRYLKRVKTSLVLDELGIEYARLFNFEYNKRNRNVKYLPRLMYLSDLAAFYHNSNAVTFIPSFNIKDKETFTITARRFIRSINYKWNFLSYLSCYKRP